MAVTQLLAQDYEAPTWAAGNLSTQAGYLDAGVGAHQATVAVVAGMDGAQAVTFTNGGATTALAVEKAIGATRAAAAEWIIPVRVKILSTASDWATANFRGIELTKGAVDLGSFTTMALRLGFGRNAATGVVDMMAWDKDYATGPSVAGAVVAGAFALDAKASVRIRIFSNDTYAVDVDTANAGETWTNLRTGTLVAANVAISRFNYFAAGAAFTSATELYDNLCFAILTTATKANLGVRPQRYAKIDTAAEEGVNTRITYSVYDPNTGNTLASGRSFLIPTEWLAATQDRSYVGRIDQAIADDLKKYDLTARVATLAASGHGLDF